MAFQWMTVPDMRRAAPPQKPMVTLTLTRNSSGGATMIFTCRLEDWRPERIDIGLGEGDDAGKLAFRPGTRVRFRQSGPKARAWMAAFASPVQFTGDRIPATPVEFTRDGDLIVVTMPDFSALQPEPAVRRSVQSHAKATATVEAALLSLSTSLPPSPNPEVKRMRWDDIIDLANRERVVITSHKDLARWNRSRAARGLPQIAEAA